MFNELRKQGTKRARGETIDCLGDEEPVAERELQESPADDAAELVLRRSERERGLPDFYGMRVNIALNEPATMNEAKWLNVMVKEIESLHANDMWDLVELPEGRKAVGSKWVLKLKLNADGVIERHKARLVAQGFSQKHGLDYDETFSPVARFESLQTVIALSVINSFKMDVTTAFLKGELEEEVYMKQPAGFITKGQKVLSVN